MKKILLSFAGYLLLFFFTGCRQQPVTSWKDYAAYLQVPDNAGLSRIDEELNFWKNKITHAPGDIIARSKIAALLTRRFHYSGNMAEVRQADSLYQLVNVLNRSNSSGTFRAMAANCITQHRFLEAQQYIDSALALGDDKYLTVLMEFDVAVELGNRYRARKALNSLVNKTSFDYLIREARYKDHVEGDLEEAIRLMEKAYATIKDDPSPALYLWVKSNLGDLYGHANRYRESYQCYLDVLAKDPHYYHALKGIAWLAFSHDKNVANARKIVAYLQQRHPVPDYDLLLSQIAAFEQDEAAQKLYMNNFIAAAHHASYGGMYNKYLFSLQANELHNPQQALQIAQQEVQNRPTPESFSWLAWAWCQNGQVKKAMETARLYVANQCFEPEVLYYLGMIYQAGGDKAMAQKYLTAAKSSSYELGPVMTDRIRQILKTL